ncbi:MAG: potassium channel family protein [Halanaerobiales bacterium]
MYIVIIGCGRTGSRLAGVLSSKEHDVVVVDKNKENFKDLSTEFSGFTVEGDGLEYDILKNAGITKADILVLTTGDDNINYMITQISRKIYDVPSILVRIIEPKKEKMFHDISRVTTLSPISLLVDSFINKIERIEG